jgi:hypothetical protein
MCSQQYNKDNNKNKQSDSMVDFDVTVKGIVIANTDTENRKQHNVA